MVEPKTQIEVRLDRIERALRMFSWTIPVGISGEDIRSNLEDILNGVDEESVSNSG